MFNLARGLTQVVQLNLRIHIGSLAGFELKMGWTDLVGLIMQNEH